MVSRVLGRLSRRFRFVTEYLPAKLLVKSNVRITQSDLAGAIASTKVERDWYGALPPIETVADIKDAVAAGRLVKVEASDNYLPTLRFRNPKLHDQYPPYLTPAAKALLDEIGRRWRRLLTEAGIDQPLKLAVHSFLRTTEYQTVLIQSGRLAQPNSPHLRGEAFDIDGSGYYLGEVPINARAKQKVVYHDAFAKLRADLDSPEFGDYSAYQPAVHEILAEVLDQLQHDGALHYLAEYPGTTYASFHVCRNPSYRA